jgi:VWFA-related protein
MKNLRTAAVAALTLGLSAFGLTQTPAPPPKAEISVEAKLVVVPTVVRDKHGALMTNLTKDNFVLQVDGQPQTIRYFDHDSDVPLTLGLLVDTSMSQRTVLDDERTASSAFLDKMLAPGRDQAFIIDFAHAVTLLQDVTDSRPKLQAALQQLDTSRPSFHSQPDGGSGDNGSGGYSRGGGGTALYDAVFLASDDVMAKIKGRRALILLTDGDDRGSKETLPSAIEAAQRANTVVYAIYYKGQRPNFNGDRPWGGHHGGHGGYGGGGYGGGGGQFPLQSNFDGGQMGHGGYGQQIDGKKILERMCGETGGRVFEVSKKLTVNDIYTQIAEELRTQYRLGFTPSTEAASDGYHKISLELTGAAKKDKPVIQTRDGYYTGAALEK